MFWRRYSWVCLFVLALLFTYTRSFAQEVQKVTITVGETSKEVFTFEPKQATVKPGKVEFTLVNKGQSNHNVAIKLNDKEVRLARAEAGKSATSEPVELAAGEYEIYCSFTTGGSHKDKGMAGKLIVK
jgi:plastocyanin